MLPALHGELKKTASHPPVPVNADRSIASPDSLCTNAG